MFSSSDVAAQSQRPGERLNQRVLCGKRVPAPLSWLTARRGIQAASKKPNTQD